MKKQMVYNNPGFVNYLTVTLEKYNVKIEKNEIHISDLDAMIEMLQQVRADAWKIMDAFRE